MRSNQQLAQLYPDVLEGQISAGLMGVVRDLDVLYAAPEPPASLHTAITRLALDRITDGGPPGRCARTGSMGGLY
jgi:hypothetical protein